MPMRIPVPAPPAGDPRREDPVWRAVLAAPYEALPGEIAEEALAAYDDAERFVRAGQPGTSPEEIRELIAAMRAEQGNDDDVDS